ncbi:MAG: hypothetical protein AAF212_12550 [Verrucomicrobiota bacterium]
MTGCYLWLRNGVDWKLLSLFMVEGGEQREERALSVNPFTACMS